MLRSCSTLGWASHSGSPLAPHCRWHPASHLRSHLSGTQLHSPSDTWLHNCTALSAHLHFTACTAGLHCPNSCTPLSRQLDFTVQTAKHVKIMLNPWVGFTLWVTPHLTLQMTPSITPQVTPVWHSASLPKWNLALHLHLTVGTPTLHCLDSCTSLSKQLHSTAQTATLHCPDSCTPLSGQLHFTVWTAAFHCLDSCTPESSQLHSTAQTATLHCPDGSPPFVPRYSWQKNNHKFHINHIAFVFHKYFHKLQRFLKTSIDPWFT